MQYMARLIILLLFCNVVCSTDKRRGWEINKGERREEGKVRKIRKVVRDENTKEIIACWTSKGLFTGYM
jgi:hypothetical protein